MKLEEIILIIEDRDMVEENYLSSFRDYLDMLHRAYPKSISTLDRAYAIEKLYETRQEPGRWSHEYYSKHGRYRAKFCQGEGELRSFLQGKYNGEYHTEHGYEFMENRCSPECLEVLRARALDQEGNWDVDALRYKAERHVFQRGEKFRDFDGESYRVLEPLSKHDLLLMHEQTGEILAAQDAAYLVRTPKDSAYDADSVGRSVAWLNARHLGDQILDIDFAEIKKEYAKEPKLWKAAQKKAPAITGPKL